MVTATVTAPAVSCNLVDHRLTLTLQSDRRSPPSALSGLPAPPTFLQISSPGLDNHHAGKPSSSGSISPIEPVSDYSSLPPPSPDPIQSLYPPSPYRSDNRDSCALSSIHTHDYPVRRTLGTRDSRATWNTGSDSDLTRIGAESPWMNKIGSTGMYVAASISPPPLSLRSPRSFCWTLSLGFSPHAWAQVR